MKVIYNPSAKYKGIGYSHPDSCINISGLQCKEEIVKLQEVIAPCASKLTCPQDYNQGAANDIQKLIDDWRDFESSLMQKRLRARMRYLTRKEAKQ